MYLNGILVNVELPFPHIALVLLVRVINLLTDVPAVDPEDRNAIGKEEP